MPWRIERSESPGGGLFELEIRTPVTGPDTLRPGDWCQNSDSRVSACWLKVSIPGL
ncbi:MAG: hypothetical protein ACI8RZ_002909 [Myxococcota bacterium]|jgi:hypothetical protein